jgi:hypothetical protein
VCFTFGNDEKAASGNFLDVSDILASVASTKDLAIFDLLLRRGEVRSVSSEIISINSENIFQEKSAETTKQREEKRKKPGLEEHEGMPHHHYCPLAKRCGDRNPKYHEEQEKDVA